VESLIWRRPERDGFQPSQKLNQLFTGLWRYSMGEMLTVDRKELFEELAMVRKELHSSLSEHLSGVVKAKQEEMAGKKTDDGKKDQAANENNNEEAFDCDFLGLAIPKKGDLQFEIESIYFANRTGPDGDLLWQGIVQIIQDQIIPDGDFKGQRMVGGCTLVVDFRKFKISYCIRKSIASQNAQARQAAFSQETAGTTLRNTYFGIENPSDRKEPFAFLHRAGA
jgi:hypothetical protein